MSKEEGSRGRIGSNFNWRSFGGHIGGHSRAYKGQRSLFVGILRSTKVKKRSFEGILEVV